MMHDTHIQGMEGGHDTNIQGKEGGGGGEFLGVMGNKKHCMGDEYSITLQYSKPLNQF